MNKKILLPAFVILALLFGACNLNFNLQVDRGSGKVITQSRTVSNFDKVLLNGIGDVTISLGDRESLEIEAEDNVIPHIQTEVSNDTLRISFDQKAIIPTKPVKFILIMRSLHGLETQGVSNVHSDSIHTDRLTLAISGTGNIDISNLQADSVTVNISGAGNLTTVGKVGAQKISMSGAGNYNGEDLESQTADITISGLGKVTAWVTNTLTVSISGTGGVDYYGNPQVSQQISGLGRLKNLGNK